MSVQAQSSAVTVFDVSDRTQIEITGADRAKFLHGFCTNDIMSLNPGQGCEAFLTNIKGRVLGHVFVYATPQSLWLDTIPGQEAAIIAHLDRYLIREDVELNGRSGDRGELFVAGSQAAPLLMLEDSLSPCGCVSREAFEQALDIRRADMLIESGYLLSVPMSALEMTRHSLLAIGCRSGTTDEFESRRIEAGFPWFGRDFSDEHLAQEVARTSRCISFTKGCYLGQEPIARLDAMGHTNRELRRMTFDPGAVPAPQSAVLAADSDSPVGVVTSVAPRPGDDGRIHALGFLKTAHSRPETTIRVAVADSMIAGRVEAPL